MDNLLDIYTDYLLTSFGQTNAVHLSKVLDGEYSHDKFTRLLSSDDFGPKKLWQMVKPLVRAHENGDGVLIFDDTIVEKPYTDENELISWHFDHSKGRSVKGINLLSCFYHCQGKGAAQPLRVPIGYGLVRKTEEYMDKKSGKKRRKSSVTKNEMMRALIKQAIGNGVLWRYVLADSWFASAENMCYIHGLGKHFIMDLKDNRLAAMNLADRQQGKWKSINELGLQEMVPYKVWLNDLELEVVVVKQVFTNGDGTVGHRYLVSNDLGLTAEGMTTTYKTRWGVEEYHKSIKQNASAAKAPCKIEKTQANHLFCSLWAYVKLEKLKLATKTNHFALKAKIYMSAIKSAMSELCNIKQSIDLA